MIYRKYQNKIKKIKAGEVYEIRELIVNEKTPVADVYKNMDKNKYHLFKVCDGNFQITGMVSEKKVIDTLMSGKGNKLIGSI